MLSKVLRRCAVPLIRAQYTANPVQYNTVRTFSEEATPPPPAPESQPPNRFSGVGQPFDREISDTLALPLKDADVLIMKDGTLHVPDEHYKDILNKAFGLGGWALVPTGDIKDLDLSEEEKQHEFLCLLREYALYCHGRFVSQAFGETSFYPGKQSYSESTEKIKVSALARCCKDIGIASELWNKQWIENWKRNHGIQEWVENVNNNRKSNLWRHKNDTWSWPYQKSTGFQKKSF